MAEVAPRSTGSLSAARSNHDCCNVFPIDEGIEKFCASQMRKMDDIVGNLFDPAANFLSRIQVQLDSFASGALQDANDGRVGLQTDLILSGQTGTDRCDDEPE
jgi:hypothetical protein